MAIVSTCKILLHVILQTLIWVFSEIGLKVLPWPENSPDLNPIEEVWYNLMERVNKVTSTSKRDLIERIIQVWHRNRDINVLIERYYASMPNRIAAVIKAKDGSTKC